MTLMCANAEIWGTKAKDKTKNPVLQCLGGFQDLLYYDPIFYVTCKFDRSLRKGVFHDSHKSTAVPWNWSTWSSEVEYAKSSMSTCRATWHLKKNIMNKKVSTVKIGNGADFLFIQTVVWLVGSNIFYFQPYLGKWSNLTNIFQMGWNHQLVVNGKHMKVWGR